MQNDCIPIKAQARFYAKVDRSGGPDACWTWLGATAGRGYAVGRGYGSFWFNGRNHRAPRIAWSIRHGKPFPEKLLACHTCDNPVCVNPAHIFVGTCSENLLDAVKKGRHKFYAGVAGWQKSLTECQRGHPFTPDNTLINSYGNRKCRICQRMNVAKYDAKRKLRQHFNRIRREAERMAKGGGA